MYPAQDLSGADQRLRKELQQLLKCFGVRRRRLIPAGVAPRNGIPTPTIASLKSWWTAGFIA
jgi:hypothetical protein